MSRGTRVDQEGTARGTVRARLLDVATDRFGTRGFAAVSMQELADAVGVTKAAMYYHFASKEDLFAEVVRRLIDGFWEGIIARAAADGSLREVLREIFAFGRTAMSSISLGLIDDIRHHLSPEVQEHLFTEHPTPEETLRDLFARAIARGEMRPLDSDTVADVVVAMVMSFGHRGHGARPAQPLDDEILLDILLHGIATPNGRPCATGTHEVPCPATPRHEKR